MERVGKGIAGIQEDQSRIRMIRVIFYSDCPERNHLDPVARK